jgi:hypothetical protein
MEEPIVKFRLTWTTGNTRGGIRCLGGVNIPYWPVIPAMSPCFIIMNTTFSMASKDDKYLYYLNNEVCFVFHYRAYDDYRTGENVVNVTQTTRHSSLFMKYTTVIAKIKWKPRSSFSNKYTVIQNLMHIIICIENKLICMCSLYSTYGCLSTKHYKVSSKVGQRIIKWKILNDYPFPMK